MDKTPKIILVGHEKGGVGKSTMATNIAVELALRKVDVLLLDADPQGTSSRWVERRDQSQLALPLPKVHIAQKLGEVRSAAKDYETRYDVVIIDAGGRDSRELRSAMVAADVIYIPLRPSLPDLETLEHMKEIFDQAKDFNPDLAARAIISMAPSNPMINETQEAREMLSEFDWLELSPSVLRERKVYRDAFFDGKGVVEMNNSQAKAEIQILVDEIFGPVFTSN